MNRYCITVNFYLNAPDDRIAFNAAKMFCEDQDLLNDDKCALVSIVRQDFGELKGTVLVEDYSLVKTK